MPIEEYEIEKIKTLLEKQEKELQSNKRNKKKIPTEIKVLEH